jgi:hypothetical protein
VAQAQEVLQASQAQAAGAEKQLARVVAQKKLAEAGLTNIQQQIATATTAVAAAQQAARDADGIAEQKWPT